MYVHRRNHVQLFAFTLTNPNQCFDGREEALLDFIHTHPNISNLRNNPSAILDTIDEFGRTKDFLMTLGPAKRGIIKSLMAEQRPKVVMDVGAYVGYSALTLGCIVRDLYPGPKGSEVKVFSFEKEPKCAAITSSFVELAGLKGGGGCCCWECGCGVQTLDGGGDVDECGHVVAGPLGEAVC